MKILIKFLRIFLRIHNNSKVENISYKPQMNKISLFGLSMAIGITWFLAIIFVGEFAMLVLENGYAGRWHENVINSVVLFRGIFGLAYPGWAMDSIGTFFAGLWGFVHGFIAGFFIAFFYNVFSKIFTKNIIVK